jgi:tetratricopeptide (TPR) repeat protein
VVADLTGELEFKRFGLHAIASVLVRGHLAWSEIWLGEFDSASRTIARAQEIVRQVPEPYATVYAYMAEGLYHIGRGEPAKAITAFEVAHRVNAEADILLPIALAWLGGALALGGRAEEAVDLLLAAERDGTYKSGGKYCWVHHYLSLAQAHLALRHFALARAALDKGREIAEAAEELVHLAWILKASGDVEAADPSGLPDAALPSYQRAIDIARPRGLLPLLAQCLVGLAETLRRCGETEPAARHYAEADGIFRHLGLPDWPARSLHPAATAPARLD